MLLRAMVDNGDVRLEDCCVTMVLMQLLILGGYGNMMMSSLLDVTFFGFVPIGTRIMIDLHKVMVAISRIEVNHDGYGGTAPDAMVWDPRWYRQT